MGREHFTVSERGRISTLMLSKRTLKTAWKSRSFYYSRRSSSRIYWDQLRIARFIKCLAKRSRVRSMPNKVSPILCIKLTKNNQMTITRRQSPPDFTLSQRRGSKPPLSINKIIIQIAAVLTQLRKKEQISFHQNSSLLFRTLWWTKEIHMTQS